MRPLVILSLSVPLALTTEAPSPQGVWVGTIGTRAITACFNKGSPWTSYGSYYYVEHLKPIRLTTGEHDAYWREDDSTAEWELADPANGAIVGTWRDPKTHTSFPISLRLVDGNDDDRACARDSYNARLEVTPPVETGRIIRFSPGRSYRTLRFAGQERIELFGPDPAIGHINSVLKLDTSEEAVRSYFQQRREFLGRVGYPAVDQQLTEPTYWDANFITVRFYVWIAGEGRSGISNDYRTWSVRTGEAIDLWQWIGADSSERQLPPQLKKFLYRHVKESAECAGGYRGQGSFTLTLATSGLIFAEEAWGNGCEKSFVVPYDKLSPFLSPIGRRAVNSILKRK